MTSTNSLLRLLHLGAGKSWLGKEFCRRYLRQEEVKEIYVNYATKDFLNEAVNALAAQFTFVTLASGVFSIDNYHLTLRVKSWVHVTDFDLVDYDPVRDIFFNRGTQQPLSEEERKRFVAKRCFLDDAVYQMFMRRDEQQESVRQQICSYLANGWIFYEQNSGEALEFLRDSTPWKCRHYRPQTIRFSIDDHEYEITIAHPIDSLALFGQMKSLVLRATR